MSINTILSINNCNQKSLLAKFSFYESPPYNQNIYTIADQNIITQYTSISIRILDIINIQDNNQIVSFELFINGIMNVPLTLLGTYDTSINKISFLNGTIIVKDCKNLQLTYNNGDNQIINSLLIRIN